MILQSEAEDHYGKLLEVADTQVAQKAVGRIAGEVYIEVEVEHIGLLENRAEVVRMIADEQSQFVNKVLEGTKHREVVVVHMGIHSAIKMLADFPHIHSLVYSQKHLDLALTRDCQHCLLAVLPLHCFHH